MSKTLLEMVGGSLDEDSFLPPEVQQKVRELEALFHLDPVLARFDELMKESQTAPLASRFRRDKRPGLVAYGEEITSISGVPIANEVEHKRAQLTIDVGRLRLAFLSVFLQAKSVMLDLEASKTEG